MKRSLSGPIVLIAIGVLFCLNNFSPEIFSWHSLGRSWPFFLIGFGVVRLLEVLGQAGSARPLPRSQFPAGGVFILLIACFALWGTSHAGRGGSHIRTMPFMHFNSAKIFGDSFDYDVKENFASYAPDTRVILQGVHGNLNVTGDDTNEVSITGKKTIQTMNQRSADAASRRTGLEISRSGTDIIVRTTGGAERDEFTATYDLDIKVPRRFSLRAEGSPENVTVESLTGDVDVTGGNGNVRLTSIDGDVRVETTRRKDLVRAVGIKGNLDVRGSGTDLQFEDVTGQVTIQGNFFGTLEFRNLAKPLHFSSEQTDLRAARLPGSISMDLGEFRAENVAGPLHLRCQSRDVHIADFNGDLEVNVDRGDVELEPRKTPLAKIDVHVRAGDISVAVPEKSPFSFRGTTSQGEVTNDYGNGINTNSEGRSASMKSDSSNGPAITVTTDRGNLTLKKS